jgi:uncharacterized membrane protein
MRIDKSKCLGCHLWCVISVIIVISIVVPTLLAPVNPKVFHLAHVLFSPTCHQLTSRSFCWFPGKKAVEDCISNHTLPYSKAIVVMKEGYEGYKFPVCARCFAIYLGLMVGAIAFLLLSYAKLLKPHAIPHIGVFLLAILPLAIDGTTQLLTPYESTNQIRLFTGLLAGITTSFYACPLFNTFLSRLFFKKQIKPHQSENS